MEVNEDGIMQVNGHASECISLFRGIIIEVNEDGASECRRGLAVALLAGHGPS